MRELFSLKAVFFSFAISLALFSCSNLQGGNQAAGGLVGQGQDAQSSSADITRTIGGSLVMSGLFPRGFGSKPSAVSKTLFPEADSVDSSALDYFVTASHAGLSDIDGTVTAGSGGVLAYPITPSTPATGVDTGIRRVVRGGSYNYGAAQSYVYYRGVNNEPQDRWENSGFRVVRNIP